MTFDKILARANIDAYTMALLGTVLIASLLPCEGEAAILIGYLMKAAIALLFFLYGSRLSSDAVMAGVTQWRLQLLVLASTFILFPLLGMGAATLSRPFLGESLASGLIFLSVLPSTVQSSIAFTSIARGNVAAALCSASVSNLLGILLTPLLVRLLLGGDSGHSSIQMLRDIVVQLFIPFGAGQVLRRWIGPWLQRNRRVIGFVDRGSILLVVYVAFSESVVNGIWHRVGLGTLAMLLIVNIVLLAIVIVATTVISRRLGFSKEDEIAIMFCGSKKSLASGIPMATILFTGPSFGLLVLPLMLFHQIQLITCAALARRYAARGQVTMAGAVAPQN